MNRVFRAAGSPAGIPEGTARNEDKLVPEMRLGLLPDQGRARLELSPFLTGVLPDIPVSANHLARVPAWSLGSNNRFGTCGPTSVANYVTMVYEYLLGERVSVTDEAIFELYRDSGNPDFDPATGAGDRGVDMNAMLNAFLKNGIKVTANNGVIGIIKPIAFAALSLNSPAEVRAVTAIFGGAVLALSLQQSQETQVPSGLWGYSPSPPWGGHAVMGAAYTGEIAGADEQVITWAKIIGLTDDFITNQVSQAYAVIMPHHLSTPGFLHGVDVPQLAAAYTELTGRPFVTGFESWWDDLMIQSEGWAIREWTRVLDGIFGHR